MNPIITAILTSLPTLLPLVERVWTSFSGEAPSVEDAAWSELSKALPAEIAPSFEPYFRAIWEHFDALADGWSWLEDHLKRGGITRARVGSFDELDVESHLAADAWIARHAAKEQQS